MAKSPSPARDFVAITKKAFAAFFTAALGSALTAVGAAQAATGGLSNLDPYAVAVAALALGAAAAGVVYKTSNGPKVNPGQGAEQKYPGS